MKELGEPLGAAAVAITRPMLNEVPRAGDAAEADGWRVDPLLDAADELLGGLSTDAWLTESYVPYEHTWSPSQFDGVGDPLGEAEFWRLQNGNSCAVNAQLSIIESITGTVIPEATACDWLEGQGYYDPATGTSLDGMNKLVESQGIPTEMSTGATIDDLADALDRGDGVIVALNAQEIWEPLRDAQTGEVVAQPGAYGHAVMITGIDQAEDGSFTVIMNDSGHPEGQMRAVALEDFLEAWNDYDNTMIVADGGADAAQS